MKALRINVPGRIEIADVPEPQVGPGEAVIAVARGGICGSDMHIYHGSNPFASYPRIPGHEFVGTVLRTGPGSRTLRPGQRVVVNPVVSCGSCHACRIGRSNVCTSLQVYGVHRDGGFAQQIAVGEHNLFPIPDTLSWDDAVFIEPFSIAANIASRVAIDRQDRVLIIGAGPIGLTVLQVAILVGAQVAVCDMIEPRLAYASSLGAKMVINSTREDLETRVKDFTDGDGPSVLIDAAGVPSLFGALTRMASPGARIGILGFSTEVSGITQYEITRKELTIAGSRLNNGKFPAVIDWMREGLLRPAALLSRAFPLDRATDAFGHIDANRDTVLKVLIDMEA